ncbi:MAG: efflux RND transporter permease subunit [Pseudomonadales bacterium]
MSALIEQLLDKRYALALLTIVIGAMVMLGIQHTSLDSSSRAVLSEGDPYRAEVDQMRDDFPPTSSVLFVFEAQPDVFSFKALRAIEDLDQRYTEIDSAIAAGSLINRRLSEVDAKRYNRDYLIPELDTLSEEDLARIRAIALADTDLTKSLLAQSGDMTLAQVKYNPGSDEQAERLSIAQSVLTLRDSLRQAHPEVQIYTLGNILFEWEGYQAQIKDNQLLFPLVVVVAIGLLWLCLKSLSFSFGLFLIAFASIGLSVGTYGWLRIPFNQISNLGPLVVFVVAVAHGIHIVSIYAQGLHQGLDKRAAMRESLSINLQPVTLATITTAIGFLCLNYCTSPGIYGFGNIVAIGVVWAYLLSLGLLPAIILALPVSKTPKPLGIRTFIEQVSQLVANRGNLLFWGSTLLIVLTLAMLPLNKLDFNRLSFVDEESDLHHVMTALAEKIGNDQSLVYGIYSKEYYGITEPEFLEQVDAFSLWLESQPESSFVTSYTDLLRSLNQSEHDDDEAFDRLPDDKLQMIDYLVGYQLIQEIEPSLEPIFNTDYSAIRLVIGTSNLSNLELVQFNDRIERWVAENLDPKFQVLHGDTSILGARLDRAITVELMQGFAFSILLITLTLIVGLKSLRYGLLSIMPNLFPATIVFGFWGLFMGEIGPYVLMLFSISIGLVVDDSVHILSKYITASRQGLAPEAAVQYSLDKAGSAITITTLSLAVGTFILVFSNTFHFQNVALLLTPIIVVALLLDLLFLPPLLVKFDRWLSGGERTILAPSAAISERSS